MQDHLSHEPTAFRVRYPLRAKLAILAAVLVFLAELAAFALWMMPMIPLVPVFIAVMLGNGFVLASVVEWAASLARSEAQDSTRAVLEGQITIDASRHWPHEKPARPASQAH
jgi:hypothetical protein